MIFRLRALGTPREETLIARNICERKGRRPLHTPNRLIAEFNMGAYGLGADSARYAPSLR